MIPTTPLPCPGGGDRPRAGEGARPILESTGLGIRGRNLRGTVVPASVAGESVHAA